MDKEDLVGVLEALLFATDQPLSIPEMGEILGPENQAELENALEELLERYQVSGRGLRVQKVAGGYRIATRPEHSEWVRALFRHKNRFRLSPAALETLALIAYRQPVTAVELQQLRGSCSTSLLRNLLERKLIRMAGRKSVVGRPILYATGSNFLTHFGLDTLEDLPRLEEVDEGEVSDSDQTKEGVEAGPS